jgi:hypothetical protein
MDASLISAAAGNLDKAVRRNQPAVGGNPPLRGQADDWNVALC